MNIQKLARRAAVALVAALTPLTFTSAAHAQLALEHWGTNQGAWPDNQVWLAGHFQPSSAKAPLSDLALVWEDAGQIIIDVHQTDFLLGSSAFTGFRASPPPGGNGGWPNVAQWVVGDFNHDGKDDIADAYEANGLIQIDVHTNTSTGPGAFSFALEHYASNQGAWCEGTFVAGDFDGDGWSDIAYVWNDNGGIDIDIHQNNRAGGFLGPERWETNQGAWLGSQSGTVIAGRFNDDPYTDIAYTWTVTSDVSTCTPAVCNGEYGCTSLGSCSTVTNWSYPIDIHASLGWANGGNGFAPSHSAPVNSWTGQPFIPFATSADVNGDGLDDLVYRADVPSNGVNQIYLTSSVGVLGKSGTQGNWPQYSAWVTGDFNGDGLFDVADPFENAGLIDLDVHLH